VDENDDDCDTNEADGEGMSYSINEEIKGGGT
jgi:hypothetical protein